MLEVKKYAAIDIGSNAMRLLIAMVVDQGNEVDYKKVSLVRLPVRLGADAFTDHVITDENKARFYDGMKAFRLIMDIHGIEDYMAFATSAMRESKNGDEIVQTVKKDFDLDIEIIDGKKEAELIYKAHFRNNTPIDSNYIYVDVGGGSTEITVLAGEVVLASKSFKIGGIRMMNGMVSKEQWKEMKEWVKHETKKLEHIEMIGSGGNINKIYSLLKVPYPNPVLYHQFKDIKETLEKMNYTQRVQRFKLNPDRADVIVPASKIYFSVMKWADSSILHVPKFGLSDGMVQLMHEKKKVN